MGLLPKGRGSGGRLGPRKLLGSRCSEMDSRPFLTLIKADKAPIFLYKFEVNWLESLRRNTCCKTIGYVHPAICWRQTKLQTKKSCVWIFVPYYSLINHPMFIFFLQPIQLEFIFNVFSIILDLFSYPRCSFSYMFVFQ